MAVNIKFTAIAVLIVAFAFIGSNMNKKDSYQTTFEANPTCPGLSDSVSVRNELNKEQQLVRIMTQTDKNWDRDNTWELFKKSQGWWEDVKTCAQSSSNSIYCKPETQWLWPY